MFRERGQALVVLVALLGLAALVVISLGAADDRVVHRFRAQRAAEAAAEAAGAVVADRMFLLARTERGGIDLVELTLRQADLLGLASAAAREVLARLDGSLEDLVLERRVDEVSVRARVARDGVVAVARVGIRAP